MFLVVSLSIFFLPTHTGLKVIDMVVTLSYCFLRTIYIYIPRQKTLDDQLYVANSSFLVV